MTINIEYEAEEKLDLDYEKIITDVVNEAVDYEKCPYEAEVNVTIVDSESIHEINKEYRNIDSPTDVLSFPGVNYVTPSDFDAIEDELENNAEDYFLIQESFFLEILFCAFRRLRNRRTSMVILKKGSWHFLQHTV